MRPHLDDVQLEDEEDKEDEERGVALAVPIGEEVDPVDQDHRRPVEAAAVFLLATAAALALRAAAAVAPVGTATTRAAGGADGVGDTCTTGACEPSRRRLTVSFSSFRSISVNSFSTINRISSFNFRISNMQASPIPSKRQERKTYAIFLKLVTIFANCEEIRPQNACCRPVGPKSRQPQRLRGPPRVT